MNHPVTVAMAIYKPQMYWLREELISLHRQTFQNFELAVWNDDPDDDYDYVSFFVRIYLIYSVDFSMEKLI